MTVLNITQDIINHIRNFLMVELVELNTDDIILYNDSPTIIKKELDVILIDINSNNIIKLDITEISPYKKFKYIGFKDGDMYEIIEV